MENCGCYGFKRNITRNEKKSCRNKRVFPGMRLLEREIFNELKNVLFTVHKPHKKIKFILFHTYACTWKIERGKFLFQTTPLA